MNKSEEINELATALALAQGELENASKSTKNEFFKSKYADLAEVLNTMRPVFSKHGLSVTQFPSYDAGVVSVETMLMHKSGQWLSGTISAPVSKQDAQGVGSATTYCRRYSLAAVAGLAQEDDDANAAVGHKPEETKKETEVTEPPPVPTNTGELKNTLLEFYMGSVSDAENELKALSTFTGTDNVKKWATWDKIDTISAKWEASILKDFYKKHPKECVKQ